MPSAETHRGPLRLEVMASGSALPEAAAGYLEADEAAHSLLLGYAGTMRDRPADVPDPYLAVVHHATAVQLVAAWVPPHKIVLSLARVPEAVDLVATDVLARRPRPAGVMGPVDVARRFVTAWEAGGGPRASLQLRTRTLRLEAVVPPASPPGGLPRLAGRHDLPVLATWLSAFEAEALPHNPPEPAPATVVLRWLDAGRLVWLWEVEGRAVSMAVAGNRTRHGRRIGVVYTPPGLRRRGYAGALVAAASQAELDSGRALCFLDTDRSNPTSNHVYEAIGYRAVIDGEVHGFATPDPA